MRVEHHKCELQINYKLVQQQVISLKSSPSLGFPNCVFQLRPIQTNSQLRPNCEMTRELTEAILAEVPEAEIEAVEGDEGILSVGSFFTIFLGW